MREWITGWEGAVSYNSQVIGKAVGREKCLGWGEGVARKEKLKKIVVNMLLIWHYALQVILKYICVSL